MYTNPVQPCLLVIFQGRLDSVAGRDEKLKVCAIAWELLVVSQKKSGDQKIVCVQPESRALYNSRCPLVSLYSGLNMS